MISPDEPKRLRFRLKFEGDGEMDLVVPGDVTWEKPDDDGFISPRIEAGQEVVFATGRIECRMARAVIKQIDPVEIG